MEADAEIVGLGLRPCTTASESLQKFNGHQCSAQPVSLGSGARREPPKMLCRI